MPDIPSDEEDSRIASMAAQRNRGNPSASASGSNPSSRHTSREPPSKRQRRSRRAQKLDVQDFVPRGAAFSEIPLEVDPDTESASDSGSGSGSEDSSESSSGSESDSESEIESNVQKGTESNAGGGDAGVSAPAPNWNKTGRGVIRTSLRGRQNGTATATATANTAPESAAAKSFEAVNGKYWRGRSLSVALEPGVRGTEEGGKSDTAAAGDNDTQMEEGEVNEAQQGTAESQSGDSDDSGSLDSEADDSILLNIGSRGQSQSQVDVISISDDSEVDAYDPEYLSVSKAAAPVDLFDTQNGIENGSVADSKESALHRFAQKYPDAPALLADLNREDMELQAKIMFYNRDINDINLQQPIMCLECLREGHLSDVCPAKECVHCGAWNRHQSSLCPKWRRCQKCRERGHDQKQCSSALRSSAAEIPCDFCGSPDHLEFDCDILWKIPQQEITAPVLVSISCAHCTSNHHLIGECPSLTRPFLSSSFTVRGIEPDLITNLNSVVGGRRRPGPPPPPSGGQHGMKIRGRADQHVRFSSPDSDDMIPMSSSRGGNGKRGGPGGNRNANRGNINIRIGNNAGKSNGPPPPPARDYRDREEPYYRGYDRQRSMSPGRDRRPGRGRGGWQPLSRSPSRGQGRPSGPPGPPPRPGRGGGGRGGGRGGNGGKRGGGGDAYRPMPSAAKKAWDKHRI
ncbi:hypothetical protein BJX76DRAFT_343990 [Aspergillus varians]